MLVRQWVPESVVVVAQDRGELCVWDAIDAPERVWRTVIKGATEGMERASGRTKVPGDEGATLGLSATWTRR